jgi:hypothetical protein
MKYIYFYYILLLSIIFFFAYLNSRHVNKENFTPYIRQMYRPYVRRARILTESFYDRTNEHVGRVLRKTGLFSSK